MSISKQPVAKVVRWFQRHVAGPVPTREGELLMQQDARRVPTRTPMLIR